MTCTISGCSCHSPGLGPHPLIRDWLPHCPPLEKCGERPCACIHNRSSLALLWRDEDGLPLGVYVVHHLGTVCAPWSGRKCFKAYCTASISSMFIWTIAQEAYQLSQTGQFFHMALQLDLDASVVIVSLEETWPRWTPCWRPSIENHHLMAGTYSGSTYKILWLSLCGLTLFLVNHCCNSHIWSKWHNPRGCCHQTEECPATLHWYLRFSHQIGYLLPQYQNPLGVKTVSHGHWVQNQAQIQYCSAWSKAALLLVQHQA